MSAVAKEVGIRECGYSLGVMPEADPQWVWGNHCSKRKTRTAKRAPEPLKVADRR
jgi:hypothetical protein